MFDDPKKQLKDLEDQLLAAEMTDEEFERFYGDIYEEFGRHKQDDWQEQEDLLADQPARIVRNYANGYGKTADRSAPKSQPKPNPRNAYADNGRSVPPQNKETGIKGLVITACLLSLGIVAVVLWWILRIL